MTSAASTGRILSTGSMAQLVISRPMDPDRDVRAPIGGAPPTHLSSGPAFHLQPNPSASARTQERVSIGGGLARGNFSSIESSPFIAPSEHYAMTRPTAPNQDERASIGGARHSSGPLTTPAQRTPIGRRRPNLNLNLAAAIGTASPPLPAPITPSPSELRRDERAAPRSSGLRGDENRATIGRR